MAASRLRTTLSGRPADPFYLGPAPQPPDPVTGKYLDYWVLPKEERARGFIRPLRDVYRHINCGVLTKIHLAIAETFARDPFFYAETYCSDCKGHFPLCEFMWRGTDVILGV